MTGKKAKFIVGLLCLVLIAACLPQQKKRPPRKKCLECHEEMRHKFFSGIVHSPVKEENCEACHMPHGLIGGTYLRQDQPDLCFPCHKELAKVGDKKSVHKPFRGGQCDKCHEVHNGPFRGLLKAERQDSCFACHDRKAILRANIHPPVEKGCETCHRNHTSDNPDLLLKGKDKTCISCHETGTEAFMAAHRGYPVKTKCVLCHSPHSSDGPAFLKNVLHQPMSDGRCGSCHEVDSAAKIVLKDTHTCEHHPERFDRWLAIAREVRAEFGYT